MQPEEPDPNQIKAWIMTNGTTLCVDQAFVDYAGWGAKDLIGRPFSTVAVNPEEFDGWVGTGWGGHGDRERRGVGVVKAARKGAGCWSAVVQRGAGGAG